MNPPVKKKPLSSGFRYIDFCAGIGSGHEAAKKLGGVCMGFAEICPQAKKAYKLLHGTQWKDLGDLTKVKPELFPDFDLMIGGFPCQSFSILGKRLGLNEPRGQIIHYLSKILEIKKPKAFLLENVKGLISHEGGKTLERVIEMLEAAGYTVGFKLFSSEFFGVPQKRERVYILGVRKEKGSRITFPDTPIKIKKIEDILTGEWGQEITPVQEAWLERYLQNKYNKGEKTVDGLKALPEPSVLDTRQSDLRIFKNTCPTLRKGRQGIWYVRNKKFFAISGVESLLLQGFPVSQAKKMAGKMSNTSILGLSGNAFTVNAIKEILSEIVQ